MKHLLTFTTLFFFLLAAYRTHAQASSTNTGNTGNLSSMKGAYSLTRKVANDGTKDSVMGNEQFKVYTDRHMIYVHPLAGDTLGSYGIGTYRIENGKVIEDIFYYSSEGEVKESFEVNIKKTGNGFSQSVTFPQSDGGSWTLMEDYNNVSRNVKTPLDGAWKQTKVTYIAPDGTTNTNNNPTQFKVFESGNFVWVVTQRDSASNRLMSEYGYGTFDMQGNDKAVEVNKNSTIKSNLIGRPITLQLAFMGKDAYRQTIVFEDGSKMIEEYQRL